MLYSELERLLGSKKCMNPDYVLDSECITGNNGNSTELSSDSGKS